MTSLSQSDRELLRAQVLAYLVERARLAFDPESIRRSMVARRYVDFQISIDDVSDALSLLKGKGLVQETLNPLGAIPYFRATADGVLFHERAPPGSL